MEKTSGGSGNAGKRSVPLWLVIVLCAVIIAMAVAICAILLPRCYTIRCEPVNAPSSEATPAASAQAQQAEATSAAQPETVQETPKPEEEQIDLVAGDPTEKPGAEETTKPAETFAPEPTAEPTAEPTEAPTPEPTAVPTEVPTPEPTAEPTAAPTPVPDYFMFGGKKIKTGEKKINGKSLGINGKKNKLKHITGEEVKDLVTLCPDLEELTLDYCYMDDYSPLGKLVKLKTLQLTNCNEGKGNPVADIGWVKGLTELRSLNLRNNNISDTASLEGLTKLTHLYLSENPLTDEDLVPIGKLTNLEQLSLYDLKKITDVSPLAKLSKLTFLHIGHNSKLKNVKPLTSLKKLVYLRLNYTKVSDLTGFGKLTALKKLDLSKCPIDATTVKELQGCKKLEKIVLEMSDYDLYTAVLSDLINEGYPVQFRYNWSDD